MLENGTILAGNVDVHRSLHTLLEKSHQKG
jgi:hypothetical protein